MGKKSRNKRKKSDDSLNNDSLNTCNKAGRYTDSPEQNWVSVSDILNETNSVLFGSNDQVNLSTFFEEPNMSDQTANKSDHSPPSPVTVNTSDKTMEPAHLEIMTCLKNIESRLSAVETRLKSLDSLENKVDKFDQEMKKLWTYIHDNQNRTDERLRKVEDMTESANFNLGLMNDKVVTLEKEREGIRDDLAYLQSQSMRNNLVFGNIFEAPSETPAETEDILRGFMEKELEIAKDIVDSFQFERVHRMGAKSGSKKRNIVAKFTLFKEREFVRKQWKHLQGTNFFMHEQFPKEVNDKRRLLLPKLKEAKRAGKRAWLSYDTLYVDGKRVAVGADS